MKFRSFLAAAVLSALAFAACEPTEENLGEARISVNPAELEFDATGEKSEVVALLATRDWHVETTPEWIVVNPSKGEGSTKEQAVTISVDPNKSNDREDEVIFTIGLDKTSVKITQKGEQGKIEKGSGTLEDPFSVAGVIEYVQSLGADVTSPEAVYVKGKVSTIATDKDGVEQCFSKTGTYGNATFFISDDGTANDQFECYRILYLGNKKFASGDTDIVLGDDVVICGKVVNYKGNTPETSQGTAYLYSLNGKTGSTVEPEDPSTVQQITCAEFIQKADPNTTYRLVGKVASSVNTSYCSFDLNDGTETVVVWTVNNKDEWKDKVKQGGTVTVRGKYLKYEQNGTVKHEMVDAYIEKFEEGDTPAGEAKGTGTLADPYNAAGATAFVKANDDKESTEDVYVKGKISSIKNTFDVEHGTAIFNISDDGSTTAVQFTAYSVLYLGNRNWEAGDAQVAVGDEVILCGKVTCWSGTYETSSKKAYIYSLNGQTTIAQTPVFGVEKTEIKVSASATGATIKVTGNVAWTATSTATIEGGSASGEGVGEFSVAFEANTDTENEKTYTATVKTDADVATKEIVVTIIQGKASTGGVPEPMTIVINDVKGSFASETDDTYGAGYAGTIEGVKIGYYKYNSTSAAVAPTDLMKVYKNSILVISAEHKIASVVLTCTSGYCKDMTAVVGEGTATAASDNTITWTPAAAAETIAAAATNAQVRISKMVITFAQ